MIIHLYMNRKRTDRTNKWFILNSKTCKKKRLIANEKKTRMTRIMMSLKEPKIIKLQLSTHQKNLDTWQNYFENPYFLVFLSPSLTHPVNHFHVHWSVCWFLSLSLSIAYVLISKAQNVQKKCLYDIIQAERQQKKRQQKIYIVITIDMQSTLMCTHMQINQINQKENFIQFIE